MSSQIVFTLDEALKKKAMKKAKEKGIPLKSFLVYCLKAFTQWEMDLGVSFVGVIPSKKDKLAYEEAKKELIAWEYDTLDDLKKYFEDKTWIKV